MIASPSRSAVKASLRRRRASTVCMASSGVAPAMNFRAITPAAVRAASASHSARSCPRAPAATRQVQPPGDARRRPRPGTRPGAAGPSPASFRAGRASMNRKSWTRTSGSSRVPAMNRSSHQARCQGLGPRPIRSNSSRPISRVRRSRASDRPSSASTPPASRRRRAGEALGRAPSGVELIPVFAAVAIAGRPARRRAP